MSKSIGQRMLICQCLSQLPTEDLQCPLLDYGKKLTTEALLRIGVAAHLDQMSSYSHIEEKIRAYTDLMKLLNVNGISGSQISRRINDLSTEVVQSVFIKVMAKVRHYTRKQNGISNAIGRLNIVDSTEFRLPENMCDWAFISKGHNAVKMHTRLVVTSKNTVFPDKIVPSTGNVTDFESSDVIIEEANATYVMDRGYGSKKNLMDWLDKEIDFVARIGKNLVLYTLEEREPTHSSVLKDETVNFGISNEPVRYIEFVDEKNQVYRILTTRFDLTDVEILEIYKNRWLIELFFKWIKGHLKMKKIWSTKPQGIWNHMFLALIAYGLSLLIKLQLNSTKTAWNFFRVLQIYLFQPADRILNELNRRKKPSKGRQKVQKPLGKKNLFFGDTGIVMVKEKKTKKK
ncbi:IS4 family transposase [Bacillus sp. Marseille-Q1617]|uniref:IS4 family transposase n=1 Tax=Bacillus sp. Marseille-Q1617 TaxID=2736887 RepID=UPI00158B64EA|nr:IS4 family transposase [Bacillus sp. Marseille-Q1617]